MINKSHNVLANRYVEFMGRFNNTDLPTLSDKELEHLKKEAVAIQDFYLMMNMTTKRLANSLYGALASAYFRYSLMTVAADICAEGQYYMKKMDVDTNEYFASWSNDDLFDKLKAAFPHIKMYDKAKDLTEDICVYGDTDSNYFEFGLIFEAMGIDYKRMKVKDGADMIEFFFDHRLTDMYERILKESYESRNGEHTMKFELEVIGKKGLWDAKKNYVMSLIWKDGKYIAEKGLLKSVGIELVKQSNSQRVKDIITKYINILLSQDDIDPRVMYSMSAKLKDSMKNFPLEDIMGKKGLGTYNKYIKDDREAVVYNKIDEEGNPLRTPQPQVRGAARYNHLVHINNMGYKYPYIKQGDKIHYYYDKDGEPFSYPDGIHYPKEFAPELSFDVQLEKLIFVPVKRLMAGAVEGIDISQIGEKIVQRGFNIRKMKKK